MSNTNNQQFLAEFVDGGQGCSRDDCEVTSQEVTGGIPHTTKHCKSCGKVWVDMDTFGPAGELL